MKNLIELSRSNTHYCCLLVNHALCKHVHRHIERSETGPLSNTALEHPELAVLNSELDVLHVVEVLLKVKTDVVKFLVDLRHCLFERFEICVVRSLGGLVERVRGADAGNDVLALRVDKPLTVELIVTVCRVT